MRKKTLWKYCLNKAGLTLLEAVISIMVIGIIAMGVTSLYFSLSRISRLSDEQLKMNAVVRVVKENVSTSLRKNQNIWGNTINARQSEDPDPVVSNLTRGLKIVDLSDQEYPEYCFNLEYIGFSIGMTKRYEITIVNNTGEEVFQFYLEVLYS